MAGEVAFCRCGVPVGGQVRQLGQVRSARRARGVLYERFSDFFSEERPMPDCLASLSRALGLRRLRAMGTFCTADTNEMVVPES